MNAFVSVDLCGWFGFLVLLGGGGFDGLVPLRAGHVKMIWVGSAFFFGDGGEGAEGRIGRQ